MIRNILNLPFVAKFVNHELGGYVTTGLGAALGWLFANVPHWTGYEVTAATQANITNTLTVVCAAIAAGIVQKVQTGNAKALQDALGVVPDGFIGPVTIKRAIAVADQGDETPPATQGSLRGK